MYYINNHRNEEYSNLEERYNDIASAYRSFKEDELRSQPHTNKETSRRVGGTLRSHYNVPLVNKSTTLNALSVWLRI